MDAGDQDGKRVAGILEPAQRPPLTGSVRDDADQHDHPDVAQDGRDPRDHHPGHVQVQSRPQCSGKHESIDGQGTPPVLPGAQDGVLVMQDIETCGPEVMGKVVRLNAIREGQHHQPQHQGGVDSHSQRGPPVAALRAQHQRNADREEQQSARALNGGELTVSHATISIRTINLRGGPTCGWLSFSRMPTAADRARDCGHRNTCQSDQRSAQDCSRQQLPGRRIRQFPRSAEVPVWLRQRAVSRPLGRCDQRNVRAVQHHGLAGSVA